LDTRATPPVAVADPAAQDAMRVAFRRLFPGVMVAMFLAAVDQSIIAASLPAIAGELGGLGDLSWIATAYLLAATLAAPTYGHLGDRFGRRRMLLWALALFTLASIACTLAPTFWALVAARALQGLGGGGLMTLSQALIGEQVPPRERGRFQGYFAAVFASASTGGPILGAYLTELVSWRAVFAINLPLGLAAAWLALRIPHGPPPEQKPFKADLVGGALFAASAFTLLFVLASMGHRFAWDSPLPWLLAAAAIAGFVLFVRWERRVEDPLMPIDLLAKPAILNTNLVVVTFAAALLSSVLYLPLYLQLGRGMSVGASGLLLLPITLAILAGSTTTGRLISKTGHTRPFPIVGLALTTLAFLGLAATVHFAATWLVLAFTMLAGFGMGCVMPTAQVIVQASSGRESLGRATASISLARATGGALGTAAVGGAMAAALTHIDATLARVLPLVAERGPQYLATLPAVEQAAITDHLGDAYRIVFLILAAITATGTLLATRIPKVRV
jgi:EmrB/QacA subfamily drug resistance transporter